jgi:hypothetical protein
MRATIDSTGCLTVVPENETEAYALRCFQEKFDSDTQPVIKFEWGEIHSPGDVKASKGSEKQPRYFPFTAEEFVRVRQQAEARQSKGTENSRTNP